MGIAEGNVAARERSGTAAAAEGTEALSLDRALRESAEGYRALLEYAPFGILTTDTQLRLQAANPALVRMLGFSREPELLAHAAAHGLFADPEEGGRFLASHAGTDQIPDAVVEWLGHGGRLVHARLSGHGLRDQRGAPLGFELIAEDLTGRRALEEQVRQAQKMEAIGRLTLGIAHDLNNLLTVVLGCAGQLDEAGEDSVSVTELRVAARRAKVMVRRLLAFSRPDALRVHEVDIAAHVSETASLLRRLVGAAIEVVVSVAPGVQPVLADESALDQVLFNLVTNAQDAMPDGGTLTIGVEPADSERQVRLVVTDTGVGMDDAIRARLFEPFFTTKPRDMGTGLGLATVCTIVTRLGGSIDVDSTPGRGTTVAVRLPTAAGSPASHN